MKIQIALSLLALAFGGVVTAGDMVKHRVPIGNIYVPFGFDSNDLSEVVVEGVLPDLCYSGPEVYLTRDGKNLKLKVIAYKEDNPEKACLRMKVPFSETVNTGILDRGRYNIVGNENTKFEKEAELKVQESASGAVDDFIYARVESVTFDGNKTVTLRGFNPSPCFALDQVKFVDNGVDTYSVLPILKYSGSRCAEVMTEFTYTAELPDTLSRKKILLHVRAMNGKSVNTLITRKN
jgi:hypothetical protein